MVMHPILLRQIAKCNLGETTLPEKLEAWQEFLKRVNQRYTEADQEHYLLERSMTLSSNEMQQLNSQLEEAQHLAMLGSWLYDSVSGKVIRSKEMYILLGMDPAAPHFSIQEGLKLVHPEDVKLTEETMKRAISQGEKYDIEIRVKHTSGEYKWFRVIGHPYKKDPKDENYSMIAGVAMDITVRKKSEEELKELNKKVIVTARQAGMAEVASSVLHNVGNVLNSVNVSASLAKEMLHSSKLRHLTDVARMIAQHKEDLEAFVTKDEKGKLIPAYIEQLGQAYTKEYSALSNEIENLTKNIQHIREVIAFQQSLSGVSGVAEKIALPQIIDEAIQISGGPFNRYGIEIDKKYEPVQEVFLEKSKLLQILVNLIRNAKEAIGLKEGGQGTITIGIKVMDHEASISVKDDGVGISDESCSKLFSFGYTTKPDGHGFGLHSCALAAKELGGAVRSESEGPNKGALFILTLPLNKES